MLVDRETSTLYRRHWQLTPQLIWRHPLFAIADPNQAANNNHVNSVSEGLPESGTKTFYENLPFHGIQAPPNKVSITIIARGIAAFCQTAWARLDLQLAHISVIIKKKIMTADASVMRDPVDNSQRQISQSRLMNSTSNYNKRRYSTFHAWNIILRTRLFYPTLQLAKRNILCREGDRISREIHRA